MTGVAAGKRQAAPTTPPRWLTVAAPLLCLAGLAVATYLTIAHFDTQVRLVCSDTGFVNCAAVTTSAQSKIIGIPVALLGLLYFLTIAPLHLPAAWASQDPRIRIGRLVAAGAGIAFVLYLVYTELFTLDQLCIWCTVVHVVTFALFVVTLLGTSETAR